MKNFINILTDFYLLSTNDGVDTPNENFVKQKFSFHLSKKNIYLIF